MNFTKLNFQYHYPHILKTIRSSNCISIDLEFSGTNFSKELINTKYDSVQQRYFKIKENIKRFAPLQVGICGIDFSHSNKVLFNSMSFNIFPKTFDEINKKYVFDMNSIKFLTSNGFDFNKTFYDGIPFISKQDYEKIKNIGEINQLKNKSKELRYFPPEVSIFSRSMYNNLVEFIDVAKNLPYEDEKNILEVDVTFVRKIFLEYFLQNVSKMVNLRDHLLEIELKTKKAKTYIVIKLSNSKIIEDKIVKKSFEMLKKNFESWFYYQSLYLITEKEIWDKLLRNIFMKYMTVSNSLLEDNLYFTEKFSISKSEFEKFKQKYLKDPSIQSISSQGLENKNILSFLKEHYNYDELFEEFGFSNVIYEISKRNHDKTPIIFHNGLLDLCQIYDKFYYSLPESVELFIEEIKKIFPNILDTKFIIENSSSLSAFSDSNLEKFYNQIIDGKQLKDFNYEIENNQLKYVLDKSDDMPEIFGKHHDAGFDALTTAYVFCFISKFLFGNHYSNNLHFFSIFQNKLMLSNLQQYLELDNPLPVSKRFEIYVIVNLPELISNTELISSFYNQFNASPIIYKLFNQNVAYIIFTNSDDEQRFLKLLNTEYLDFSLINFSTKAKIVKNETYLNLLKEKINYFDNVEIPQYLKKEDNN
jgi:hypothetical protein